ncbi:tripartite tricarboxylate transporter substrate binding protein [Bradyrhizobium sp. CCBAU 51753]|uniref:Bug family tripartite tricarboxylate transporter substrate binding protein n=1 Tax=Bradyrhizobium sp. CCBAU 51753 TaxID=1325100 RepID=UPI00188C5D95|nr:tripartite tricarboxylate transporter substrate binding protein [Bradyrhizobium sp. CCBAU 51753]QOZ23108.1 tripartite tricarboxylate transporter substrate binding protein [Bradyrhizobium sp. CCBAU 51753]
MLTRRHLVGLAVIAAPAILSSRARAADWPAKPVRIVVPFTPGGSTDITARLVGNRLQEVWGQTVVVENKPGAGGNIAADLVAHSEADGYTVFIVGPGMATNPFLYPSLSYDPVNDFAPVTMLITQPNLMCVPNSSPATSVQAFIAHCNANRGKVTYASSGNGTTLHLSGELFKRLARVEMTHIPYRGGAPAINDLIPGRVDVIFDNMPSILSHVQAGHVRALAVTTKQRVALVPEIPTLDESGVPGFDVFSWFGFFVPAKTPPEVIAKINADTNAALVHPPVKTRFEQLGASPKGSTPAELAAFLKSETDKWGPVIRDARIKLEN